MQQIDSAPKPWHQHGLVWFLLFWPTLACVAGGYTWWLAARQADPMVVSDYYKQGKAINQSLAREAVAANRGISAQIQIQSQQILVALSADQANTTLPKQLFLHLIHPTLANQDQHIVLQLQQAQAGQYQGRLFKEIENNVKWNIRLEDPELQWRVSGSEWLQQEQTIKLGKRT